ncbi:MAG: zinc ribbon domain-containing protein [Burkholderiaceae bacterium]|nr:zinc ribbon domain-containing protein [Rhodoferax sp.]MCP5286329.1 zinc ribbon domain-containing protein [Burkholderiaceae bacterium]
MNRLSLSQCPACAQVNPPRALACSACGTPLITRCPACETINVRSRVRCHHCAALLDPTASPQAAPAEAPVPAELDVVPLLDPVDDTVPDDWVLALRAVPDAPSARARTAAMSPLPTLQLPADWLADEEAPDLTVMQRDPAQAAAAPSTPATPSAPAAPPAVAPPPTQALAERKARRRAAVREAQVQRQAELNHTPSTRDVLVLEADPSARADLCQALTRFGFVPHVAVSAAEAAGLSRRQWHAVAFLGLGSDCDSSDTEALCRSLHDLPRGRPLALIAVADRRRHADRIRMQLAGADQVLFRPVGRGDIARALDDCGLRLPDDPRQHGTRPGAH